MLVFSFLRRKTNSNNVHNNICTLYTQFVKTRAMGLQNDDGYSNTK